jgi:hypothetical protein
MTAQVYTTQLQAGLGLVEETRKLLALWSPGMSATELNHRALESGQFPRMTSRRLRNVVVEGFKPRYLIDNGAPAALLQKLTGVLNHREFNQLLFLYTCRANLILADFVRNVYWNAYSSGKKIVGIEDARTFVSRANVDRKTFKPWSDETITRMSSYLPACCADFGLLEDGEKKMRKILPNQIEARVMVILAYDLHFAGLGDNTVLGHPDWMLFGMERNDVLNEFKRLALKGWWIVQSAGEVTRVSWQYPSMEELIYGLAEG